MGRTVNSIGRRGARFAQALTRHRDTVMRIRSRLPDGHIRTAGHSRDHQAVEGHVDREGPEVFPVLKEGTVNLAVRRIEEDKRRRVFLDYKTNLNVLDQRRVCGAEGPGHEYSKIGRRVRSDRNRLASGLQSYRSEWRGGRDLLEQVDAVDDLNSNRIGVVGSLGRDDP